MSNPQIPGEGSDQPAVPRRPMTPLPGACSDCKRRSRPVFAITKQGGGSYRRAQRSYASHICGECVMDALPSAYRSTHSMATHRGYDTTTLIDIAENLIAVDGDRDLQVTTNDFHPDRPWERVVETRSASALVAEYRQVVDERLAAYRSARLNTPGDTQRPRGR